MFLIDSPATCERIRMACIDEFTKQVCMCEVCHVHARASFVFRISLNRMCLGHVAIDPFSFKITLILKRQPKIVVF